MKKNFWKSLMQAAVLVCTPLVIASCDDAFGDPDNPVSAHISINNAAVKLELHADHPDAATYTRTATAATGAEIKYSSTNEEVATVDATTGKITAVGEGECEIIAKATGKDSHGNMTYQETEVSFPVTVKDWRARIALTEDVEPVILNVADYVATPATTVDLTEVLDVWPALGTDGLTITYQKVENVKGDPATVDPNGIISSTTGGKITLSGATGMAKVIAKIAALADVPTGYEITSFAEELETDTFTIKVKEGIAYMAWDSEKGKTVRKTMFLTDEGATESNYTVLDNAWASGVSADVALDGGTYFITANADIRPYNIKVNGDANFILADGIELKIGALIAGTPDTHVLNIFGQTAQDGGLSPKTNGDAVADFKAINVYGGNLAPKTTADGCGGFNKNGAINIFEGYVYAMNQAIHGYGIKGAVNLKGYKAVLDAIAAGTNAEDSYAIIGDATVEKGELRARSNYRAVSGTVTATTAKQSDDTTWGPAPAPATSGYDGTWAAFTGTPTMKCVWALGEEEADE